MKLVITVRLKHEITVRLRHVITVRLKNVVTVLLEHVEALKYCFFFEACKYCSVEAFS